MNHLNQDVSPELLSLMQGEMEDPNASIHWAPKPRRQQHVVTREQQERRAALQVLRGEWKASNCYGQALFSAQKTNRGAPPSARLIARALRHEFSPYDAALNGCRSEEEKTQVQRIILRELGRRHPRLRDTLDELMLSRGL